MLRVTERASGDVMVIALRGRLTVGNADATVCDRIRHVLFRGYRRIVMDLALASSSDASGVSALLGALLDARATGAEVRLANANVFTNLQILTALLRYFDAHDSTAEALEGFGSSVAAVRDTTAANRALERAAERGIAVA